MIDVSFEINGRSVHPNQIGDALEKALYQEVANSVARRLQSVRCLTHDHRPKVKCVGRGLDELNFEISGCCSQLIEQATNKLK